MRRARWRSAFPAADTFDPDRWLPERTTREQRDAFMPFAIGARKCIGDVFGLTEASIALSVLLQHWRFAPAPGSRPSPRPSLSLHPRRLRLRLHPRERAFATTEGDRCPPPSTPRPS
ncbi:cytochrome P450 [Kitasatospora xanthocidica]|uniref:cytochrome P450 n=1 Tax=Kitasatospora xanthocidica TaxID=83382 RepID=UPI0036E58010